MRLRKCIACASSAPARSSVALKSRRRGVCNAPQATAALGKDQSGGGGNAGKIIHGVLISQTDDVFTDQCRRRLGWRRKFLHHPLTQSGRDFFDRETTVDRNILKCARRHAGRFAAARSRRKRMRLQRRYPGGELSWVASRSWPSWAQFPHGACDSAIGLKTCQTTPANGCAAKVPMGLAAAISGNFPLPAAVKSQKLQNPRRITCSVARAEAWVPRSAICRQADQEGTVRIAHDPPVFLAINDRGIAIFNDMAWSATM